MANVHIGAISLPELSVENALHCGSSPALLYRSRGGVISEATWEQTQRNVGFHVPALKALGFREGSLLLAIGELSPDWLWIVMAAHRLGGTVLALGSETAEELWHGALASTRIRFAFATQTADAQRALVDRHLLAADPIVICSEASGLSRAAEASLVSVSALQRLGCAHAGAYQLNAQKTKESSLAPAFITFDWRPDRTFERRAHHHDGLVREARALVGGLGPNDSLHLDPASSPERVFSVLTQWLLSGSRLLLGEIAATTQLHLRSLANALGGERRSRHV